MNKKTKFLSMGLLGAALMIMSPVVAQAAGVNQNAQTETSVAVSWAAVEGADYYTVHYNNGIEQAVPVMATSYTLDGLNAGSEYSVKVSYTDIEKDAQKEYYVGDTTVKTLPGQVTNVTQRRWYMHSEAVNVIWDTQPSIDGYEYIVKDYNGNKVTRKTTEEAAASVMNVHNNTNYNIKVRAYSTINGQKVYGKWSDKAYLFAQPLVTKYEVKDGKMKLEWKKIKDATSYDIYVSTSKTKGYWKVKHVNCPKKKGKIKNKNKATVKLYKGKKFKSGKKYYVTVVANRKIKKQKRTYTSGKFYAYNTKIKRVQQITKK